METGTHDQHAKKLVSNSLGQVDLGVNIVKKNHELIKPDKKKV